MKKCLSKVSKYLMLLAFTVFTIAVSLNITSYAAGEKVTNLKQVDAGETSVKISYDAPLGANKFTIYISEYNTFPSSATVTTVSYSSKDVRIYGLNPNHTYFVKVIPTSPTGQYSFSDVITCVTDPENLQDIKHTQSTTSSVTVSWSEPLSGAQYYNIYYKPTHSSVDEIYVGSTSNKNFTVKNLADDTEYNIYVYPIRKSANGYEAVGYSRNKSYIPTVAKANKLSQIKLYRWEPGSTTASIKFTNSQKNQSGIEIEISNLSGKKIKSIKLSRYSSTAGFSLSKIKNKGFQYRFRYYVTTNTKNCYGPWTSKKVVIPFAKTTVKKNSSNSLKISWKKISGATSYSVYVAKTKDDNFKKVATVKSTSYILKNTKKRQDYYIYVKANGVKCGKKKYASVKPQYQNVTLVWYGNYKLYTYTSTCKN